jgi:penicillin-binding protein 2
MLVFDQLNKADRHLRVLSWLIALGLFVLLLGLWWVQVVRSRQFVEDQHTQSYRSVRVPAPRGKIMDRNGLALAENRPVYSVNMYLGDPIWRAAVQTEYFRLRNAARNVGAQPRTPTATERFLAWFGYDTPQVQHRKLSRAETTALGRAARYTVTSNIVARLSAILDQPLAIDEKSFHTHYEQRLVLPLPILRNLTAVQVARFQERGLSLPGVDMEVQPARHYPEGTVAAHVLGCLTRADESAEGELAFFNYHLPDYRGLYGIEASLDAPLRGRAGAKSVLVNNLGYRQNESTISPVEAGKDITLTIDTSIQREAERALASAAVSVPPLRGAVVVLDVRSGEVLALVSAPAFNPNDWIPFLPHAIASGYTNEYLAPLRNRAIYGNYAPGSTFKIFVALAGLEAGTLDPEETLRIEANPRDTARGIYYVGPRRHPFKDTAQPGDYNFRRAFIRSSNGYFIEQGLRVTPQAIIALAEQFQFGERTGIPLPDSRGLLPTADWVRRNRGAWSPVATGNLSIGQGDLDMTPLQLAVAVGAVANGGKVLTPQLVMSVRGPDELVPPGPPAAPRPIVRHQLNLRSRSLDVVRQAMLADVEDPLGTGHGARVPDFRVCGKTGTAQVERGAQNDHFTWFASYGPFEDPRYAVVVMVESGASGGGTCAPVARRIYEKLKYRERTLPAMRGQAVVKN